MHDLLIVTHRGNPTYLLRLRIEFMVDAYHYPLYKSAIFAIPTHPALRADALMRILATYTSTTQMNREEPGEYYARSAYFVKRRFQFDQVVKTVTEDRNWTNPITTTTHCPAHLADLLYY